MAAEDANEESWLYGSGEPREGDEASAVDGAEKKAAKDDSPENGEEGATDNGDAPAGEPGTEKNGNEDPMDTGGGEPEEVVPNPADEMEEADREDGERLSGEENSESEDSDDDINVVIGDIKSGPNYNIKNRGTAAAGAAAAAGTSTDKAGKPAAGGKFNMEEFESVGTINGTPSHEFSIDSLDEKPWRKPGADITDYFNYGFNEETWRMYCERQKRMRQNESGVGLQGLMVAPQMVNHSQVDRSSGPGGRTLTPIANDNSKYGALSAVSANRRAGPPPGRRMTGAIDVIGGNGLPIKQENVIQVMTAERREYSRPGMPGAGKFDMPPPVFPSGGGGGPGGPPGPPGGRGMGPGGPPQGGPGGGGGGPGGPIIDAFEDEFSYGYEPTQDSQWGASGHGNQGWAPSGIKELTPMVPQMVPAPMGGGGMPMGMGGGPPGGQRYPPSDRPNDRERSMRGERSDREREPRDRDRSDRSERGGADRSGGGSEKERSSSDRRSERESSRRRDRSRSRERSRRRSRSREKAPSSSSSSSTRHRERSGRDDKEKKREGKDKSD